MITAAARDFAGWRAAARGLLASGHAPGAVCWLDGDAAEPSLFGPVDHAAQDNTATDDTATEDVPMDNAPRDNTPTGRDIASSARTAPLPASSDGPRVPADFLALATRVACHRDAAKWALLYDALWRLTRGEPHLLRLATDPLTHRLGRLDGDIRRDSHKAKAFVRFRRVEAEDGEHYIAWHRPDHRVLPLVAPFFQRRFAVLRWSILTPDESVAWDGEALRFGPPPPVSGPVGEDAFEDLWRDYYRATFNPARLNVRAMVREMPRRHWATLPETRAIPELLRQAGQRVATMLDGGEGVPDSAARLPDRRDHESLRTAAAACRACPLHLHAGGTVFGAGPTNARVMLVGEQPGDAEDRAGQAFVGPSAQVLDTALMEAGVPREAVYVTNAVKHFRFEQRGKRQLHRSPGAQEITACKPWLLAEIALIRPRVIVTLGVTAARAVLHHGFALGPNLNRAHARGDATVLTTWHPAAVLRADTPERSRSLARDIADCLREAARLA